MKELDTKIEELKKLYTEKPTETINTLNETIINLKNNTTEETINKKYSKKTLISGIFVVCILLISITNISYGMEYFMMYFFGAIFFLAGLFIGLNVPVFGIIFLFTHGCTGLGLMCLNKITQILESPIMTDNPSSLQTFLLLGVGLIVIGIVTTIIYNISKQFKNKEYSLVFILGVLTIGITIIQVLPYAFNIALKAL